MNISDPQREASEIKSEKHLKSENLEEIKHFRARNKIKDETGSQRAIWLGREPLAESGSKSGRLFEDL